MLIKSIKGSLTIKIFFLMSFLLLAAGGITYAAIAHFLPVTYSNRLEEDLDEVSRDMVKVIEGFSDIGEAETAIELFEAGAQVSVTILDKEGNCVRLPVETGIVMGDAMEVSDGEAFFSEDSGNAAAQEKEMETARPVAASCEGLEAVQDAAAGQKMKIDQDSSVVQEGLRDAQDAAARQDEMEITQVYVSDTATAEDRMWKEDELSALKQYELNVGNKRYVMFVSGGMQPVNQAMDVLKEIFPYILGLAALTAFLSAWAASFYLTAPVISLSRISRKMAVLDFADTYQGKRTDEIGILGRDLNVLSQSLSRALADLRKTNARLQEVNAELSLINGKLQEANAELELINGKQKAENTKLGTVNEKLEKSNAKLEEANTEMQRVNDRLRIEIEMERELDRQRLAFFSAVSHELKTPVTILEGHLTGMIEGIGGYKNREYYLGRSRDTVRSMGEMVQELLTVSRMESRESKMQKTDLAELLRLQVAELAELMESRGLELAVDVPEHCYAEAEPLLMEKVFRNLLTNAIRYTPEHEGNQIRVRMEVEVCPDHPGEKEHISRVSFQESGSSLDYHEGEDDSCSCEGDDFAGKGEESRENGLYVCIENTGTFIPQSDLPHLFEAFYRVEQSRNRETGGSGLGLYIVKMALERHGAQYGIRNTADGVEAWFHMK